MLVGLLKAVGGLKVVDLEMVDLNMVVKLKAVVDLKVIDLNV